MVPPDLQAKLDALRDRLEDNGDLIALDELEAALAQQDQVSSGVEGADRIDGRKVYLYRCPHHGLIDGGHYSREQEWGEEDGCPLLCADEEECGEEVERVQLPATPEPHQEERERRVSEVVTAARLWLRDEHGDRIPHHPTDEPALRLHDALKDLDALPATQQQEVDVEGADVDLSLIAKALLDPGRYVERRSVRDDGHDVMVPEAVESWQLNAIRVALGLEFQEPATSPSEQGGEVAE